MTWTKKTFTHNGAACGNCSGTVGQGAEGWTNPDAARGKRVRCLACGAGAKEIPDDLARNIPGATLRERAWSSTRSEDEWTWNRGAEGEESVAWQLRDLDYGWRALHSVKVGTGEADIDHIVIGPPGVFTLNTKNHLGKRVTVYDKTVYVSGKNYPYISKSRAEGVRASRLLSAACRFPITVKPVLVIMARHLDVKSRPMDVGVIDQHRVVNYLESHYTRFSQEHIEAVYAVSRSSFTWDH